jgi:hypothetical protein
MAWRVFAATATGTWHSERGQPCQDACAHVVVGDLLCAAVCDGAGSASLGQLGAQYVAASLVQRLSERLAGAALGTEMDQGNIERVLEELLHGIREELRDRAVQAGVAVSEFATTLVGAVATGDGGWLFHVGDGVGVARPREAGSQVIVSRPENGEYCNETYFVSSDAWRAHLRTTRVALPLGGLVLMSDGAAPFVMARGGEELFMPFIDPVERFLEGAQHEAGCRALAATLADPRTHGITGDDKTLLIAHWVPAARVSAADSCLLKVP